MAKLLDAISLGAIALNADTLQLSGESATSRIQIAKTGSWPASNKRKGGFSITSQHLRDMVKNHVQEVPIDYNHLSTSMVLLPDQGIAAGWIEKLELEDGDAKLFATSRWTPKATNHIRNGEFRYISPTISLETVDPATGNDIGASLIASALTNLPFLKGMQPVALSDLCDLGIVKLVSSDELSFDQKRSMVSSAVSKRFESSADYVYVVDIFDDNLIINRGGR